MKMSIEFTNSIEFVKIEKFFVCIVQGMGNTSSYTYKLKTESNIEKLELYFKKNESKVRSNTK